MIAGKDGFDKYGDTFGLYIATTPFIVVSDACKCFQSFLKSYFLLVLWYFLLTFPLSSDERDQYQAVFEIFNASNRQWIRDGSWQGVEGLSYHHLWSTVETSSSVYCKPTLEI